MTSIKAKQSKLNKDITKEQCEKWAGIETSDPELAGKIHPITGEEIANPNSTAKNSHNVLISNACASKFGIYRPGNPYQPDETISAAYSNRINSSLTSLSSVAQNTKYEWVKDILFSNKHDDLSKIHMLVDWKPVDNYADVWHPPYYGIDDIHRWFEIMKQSVKTDTFPYIERDFNEYNIYSGSNYRIYFKTIIYAFVYGYKMNIPPLNNEIPKQFIKLVKKVFVQYKLSSLDTTGTIQKDFGFLFYPKKVDSHIYFTMSGIEQKTYQRNVGRRNIDGETEIANYFNQTVRKYNRSIKSLLPYKKFIEKYDLRQHNSMSSPSSEMDIETQCIDKIRSITNEKFEKFKNHMIKACKKYSEVDPYDSDNMNINDVRKYHQEKFKAIISKIEGYLKNKYEDKVVVQIDMQDPLKSLFGKYLLFKEKRQINILHLPRSLLIIKVETKDGNDDIAIDAGGIKNQLFNDIAKQLFEKQIFIKSDIDNAESEKYFINPKFRVQDIGVKGCDFHFEQTLTDDFWTFVGSLCQFFLLNSYKFPQQFSSFILSGFLNEHFAEKKSSFMGLYTRNEAQLITKQHDFLYYMMRDFPQLANVLINVINEENIKDAGVTLNSFVHLAQRLEGDFLNNQAQYTISENKITESGTVDYQITNQNYENYLHDLAKNIYVLNPIKDDDKHNSYYAYANFFAGISIDVKKGLRRNKTTLETIDNALIATKWSEEIVDEFITNIIDNTELYINKHYKNNSEVNAFFDDMKSTFASKLMTYFPEYNDKALLAKFWSGWEDYNANYKYAFNIDPARDKNKYPASHTCFTLIDVSIQDNVVTFWEKLQYSVSNTFNVFSAMGGKKGRKKVLTRVNVKFKKMT